MSHLLLNIAAVVLVVHLLLAPASAALEKRCQSVCSRSDGQEFCQRCRTRVPMRFGKRGPSLRPDQNRLSDGFGTTRRVEADDDNDSRYEDQQSGGWGGLTPQERREGAKEGRILLSSLRRFMEDLEEWNKELREQ